MASSRAYRFFALALLGLALFSTGERPAGAQGDTKPVIEIPRMREDLGDVFERSKYEYSFKVRNRGTAELKITSVNPGCGCTVAKYDSLIAPGQEGRIDFVLDGERVTGKFSKTATVLTNDPANPKLTLTIAGNEISYVEVVPPGTIYLHGRFGEAIEKKLTMRSNEKDTEFKILGLSSDIDAMIDYRYEPGPKPGEYTLQVTKDPAMPTSNVYGSLKVRTSSKNSPETVLQVHVQAKGWIVVTPTVLNFGAVKFADKKDAAAPVTKAVVLTRDATSQTPLTITDVTSNNPNFKATLTPVEAGRMYRIEVTFQPPAKQQVTQRETGELTISTSDPREPSVKVNLVARAI